MRIIYTYGVFDILHPGHIRLLEMASLLGDYLIVGIVTDAVINKSKGNGRPVINESDRWRVIKAVYCVDRVVYQDYYDPTETLVQLKQNGVDVDTVVHGDDFSPVADPEYLEGMGIKIVQLPYSKGYSTTKIIEKIQRMGDSK